MSILLHINWLGAIIGAVLAYLLGAFWFSPRGFGKIWLAALGKTSKQLQAGGSVSLPMLAQAVYTLLLAIFIAVLHAALYADVYAGVFCLAVIGLMLLQFIGIHCGALFQQQNLRLPLVVGSFEVTMTLIIAVAVSFI